MPCTNELAQLPTPMIATRTLPSWWRAAPLVEPLVVLTVCAAFLSVGPAWGVPREGRAGHYRYSAKTRSLHRLPVPARPDALQLFAHVEDALERREDGQAGQHIHRRREQLEVAERGASGEHQADRQDDHTHRAGRQAHLALDAESLG